MSLDLALEENSLDWLIETKVRDNEEDEELQDSEPEDAELAHALTWEGYGSLDLEGRRKMIKGLWALYDRRRKGTSRGANQRVRARGK